MSSIAWTAGNRVELLENGEEFFPAVNEAIAQAHGEVLLETFIFAEDMVGTRLRDELAHAAQRGVAVSLLLDGYGTPGFSEGFAHPLLDAGVRIFWFDPRPPLLGYRTNLFRRLHRKLVVVDGAVAFVGGINFSVEHLRSYGEKSKQDYAVRVQGPLVERIRGAMSAIAVPSKHPGWLRPWWRQVFAKASAATVAARAALVLRDDRAHRSCIEHAYRLGIRAARQKIVIANAYFFPGFRLLRDLRKAARRGVDVHLILQGCPDMPVARWLALTLYDSLLRSGVHIHEYCERPLHGKVGVIDGRWATVGSSNLDPLSLYLNLEANVVVEDAGFARTLQQRLEALIQSHCVAMAAPPAGPSTPLRNILGFAAFHLLRHLPQLAGWLPAHRDGQMAVRHSRLA